jgi:hypothetical protein
VSSVRPLRWLPLLVLAACAPAPGPGPVTGTNTAPSATSVAPVPPTPPPPAPAEVTAASAWAGGATTPLAARGETTVDPTSSFRVELPAAVADARLTLLDQGEALVTGKGQRSVGVPTTLTFQPDAPLAAGGRYRLRLDGASTRELHAADGTVALPVDWWLTVAGEPPADKDRPGSKKRRK